MPARCPQPRLSRQSLQFLPIHPLGVCNLGGAAGGSGPPLWRGLRTTPQRGGWPATVLHRCLNLLRTHGHRRKHEERACSQKAEDTHRDDPSCILANRELRATLSEALDELPDDYRAVIVLREVEQLDYEAMAELLQVP